MPGGLNLTQQCAGFRLQELSEGGDPAGATAAQRAAALLTAPDRCSAAVVLHNLEWLAQVDPAAALPVLKVSAIAE
jgi:hypothetical protein